MLDYKYITSAEQLPIIAQEIVSATVLGEDLETTGYSPLLNDIRIWSINTGKNIYVIDLFKTGFPEALIQAHRDTKAIVVGQNWKFDQKFLLHHFGLETKAIFDAFRASHLLWNGRGVKHSLYDIYRRELNFTGVVSDMGGSDWSAGELSESQKGYAAEDVTHLPTLRDVMKPKLANLNLNAVALIEFQSILPEAAVELSGFYLNRDAWLALAQEHRTTRDRLQKVLWKELPDPTEQLALPGLAMQWNLDSPPQMLQSLRKAGMDIESTSEATLAMLADRHPVVNTLLSYREATTRLKMFGPEYLDYINSVTGRLHPEYFPYLLSGRFACSKPNLAQIPRDKVFRKCFQAQEGHLLVLADYGNIEMRIAAEVSNDEVLTGVFKADKDAHRFTASIMTGKSESEITKNERQQAKPVNFGFLYGMMPPKLVVYAKQSYGVTLSLKEAESFREKYFERFQGLRRWHGRALRDGKRNKAAWSLAGRLRFLDGEEFYNEFLNHPVQATGADGLKTALRKCYDRFSKLLGQPPTFIKNRPLPKIRMVHHVHDEIIAEVLDEPGFVDQVKRELEQGMVEGMQPLLPHVPVTAEGSAGKTWADKA